VGYLGGAVVGAFLITVLNNWLQNILPALLGQSGNYEVIVSGVLLIVLLQKSPKGLWQWVDRFLKPLFIKYAKGTVLFNTSEVARDRVNLASSTQQPKLENVRLNRAHNSPVQEVILKVINVHKYFGGLRAVNGVNFELRAAQIMGLIGPNGAGKSTLFNLISGVLPLSSGRIEFLGGEVQSLPARARSQLGMARSFQHVRLIGQMSALDNVLIGAHTRAKTSWLHAVFRANLQEERALKSIGLDCLRVVGLESVAQQNADTLSLGQQRLLEIARALASDPVLLLLDEPAAGLRHFEKQELQATLKRLSADQGVAILIVEHDMDFVMGLVDELVVMDFGNPIAHGSPLQVRENPLVIEAYLGGID